jgi:hypothetical protein
MSPPGKLLSTLQVSFSDKRHSASKKLLDAHVTTDPPPQFERLGSMMNYVRHSEWESPNEGMTALLAGKKTNLLILFGPLGEGFHGSSSPPSPGDEYLGEQGGLASDPPLTPRISEPIQRGVPAAGAMVHPDADGLFYSIYMYLSHLSLPFASTHQLP